MSLLFLCIKPRSRFSKEPLRLILLIKPFRCCWFVVGNHGARFYHNKEPKPRITRISQIDTNHLWSFVKFVAAPSLVKIKEIKQLRPVAGYIINIAK